MCTLVALVMLLGGCAASAPPPPVAAATPATQPRTSDTVDEGPALDGSWRGCDGHEITFQLGDDGWYTGTLTRSQEGLHTVLLEHDGTSSSYDVGDVVYRVHEQEPGVFVGYVVTVQTGWERGRGGAPFNLRLEGDQWRSAITAPLRDVGSVTFGGECWDRLEWQEPDLDEPKFGIASSRPLPACAGTCEPYTELMVRVSPSR